MNIGYFNRLVDIHLLEAWDMPYNEEIYDNMDGLWEELNDVERMRARGLSADLYSLSKKDSETFEDKQPLTIEKLAELKSMELKNDDDCDVLLEQLRHPHPDITQKEIDNLRGKAWQVMKQPTIAKLFFENING